MLDFARAGDPHPGSHSGSLDEVDELTNIEEDSDPSAELMEAEG